MDYRRCAEELIDYTLKSEERLYSIVKNIRNLIHGENGALAYLLEKGECVSAKELSEQLKVNTSRVAAILNALEKKGYVVRRPDPSDHRKVCVTITDSGREHILLIRKMLLDKCSSSLSRLGEEEASMYLQIMKHICELHQEMSEEGLTELYEE